MVFVSKTAASRSMLSVAEQSRGGSRVDLEADLEAVDTQRQFRLGQWVLVVSVALLVDQVDQVASEVVSEAASMVEGAEVDLEEASKTVEVMEAEGGASASEAVSVEEIVVGMEDPTEYPLLMPQPDQVAVGVALAAVDMAVGEAIPVLQIATAQRLVGMTRVVAVAHMKTDPADIVAATEVMVIAMAHLEVVVVVIWSR
jgi:hypothetical protein